VAVPRFGYAATSASGWRFAPPCCAGLRATHQFLQRSWRVCWRSCASSSIALTLPSNGHPTAGHTGSLRHGQPRRWLPLMSNVRPRMCLQKCLGNGSAISRHRDTPLRPKPRGSGASSCGQCGQHGEKTTVSRPAHPRRLRTHSAWGVRPAAATGRMVERRSPECSRSAMLTRSSATSSRSMRLSTQPGRGAVFGGVRERPACSPRPSKARRRHVHLGSSASLLLSARSVRCAQGRIDAHESS